MSMLVFSPIFPFLSVLGGLVAGVIIGLLFAIIFVAAYYRDFPFHLIVRGSGGIILVGTSALISFIAFRFAAGLPDFSLTMSLSHIVDELVRSRVSYLLLGIVAGFLSIVATFLGGLARGSSGRARGNLGHSTLRGLMARWQ